MFALLTCSPVLFKLSRPHARSLGRIATDIMFGGHGTGIRFALRRHLHEESQGECHRFG